MLETFSGCSRYDSKSECCRYAVADFDRAVELGYSKAAKRRDSLRAMLDAQTPTTPGRVSIAAFTPSHPHTSSTRCNSRTVACTCELYVLGVGFRPNPKLKATRLPHRNPLLTSTRVRTGTRVSPLLSMRRSGQVAMRAELAEARAESVLAAGAGAADAAAANSAHHHLSRHCVVNPAAPVL